ncbi:hypothetical protein DICPUDRAFT_151116 [Dictyostelium purpureum]|uniref:NIF3-like protein 1 n=1 Tax=Dictyostelium purpureum TaxID=5786 RepID=F0ZI11_DICPU|nr:uncharacterized protein DICPUDRAFT_151116 [Dictyostelium purpureum]EGC36430.1 hypothetical protein DICPUDRAFT_151116 [Dictyostelium purpureum]|eukprot:XP_003287063.1 hypothetical protein DICPUDRAFT_151116 [Dictyostelium purpureum]
MSGIAGKEVLDKLNRLVPLNLAEKWDNVGLLVEPSNTNSLKIEKIFLTNDLTEPVLQEAIDGKANFIISYHPPLFNQFKTVNQKSIPQRIAIKAIENKIPVYSPHSALDSCTGGLNDWIAQALIQMGNGKGHVRSITPFMENPTTSHKITCYLNDSHSSLPTDAFSQLKLNSTFQYVDNKRIELSCNQTQLPVLLSLVQSLNKEIYHYDISVSEKIPSMAKGGGKLVTLENEVDIDTIISGVKKLFKLEHIRLGRPLDTTTTKKVKTISLCAGSGGSLIFNEKADLYLTGELTHHVILDACAKGSYVIVCDHSNSERGYLDVFKTNLEKLFDNKIEILISKLDKDPLEII